MQNKDQMHPEDKRNLIIFAVISIVLWLSYDHFVAQPQAQKLRAQQQAVQAAAIAAAPSEALEAAKIRPREEVVAAPARLKLENKGLSGSLNLEGARLDDLLLKGYYQTAEKKKEVALLSPARTDYPRYVEFGWTANDSALKMPNRTSLWRVKPGSPDTLTPGKPVTLQWDNGQGLIFEKTITMDDQYGFEVLDTVQNESDNTITVYPYALVTEHGLPEDFANRGVIHEGPIGYIGGELEERQYSKMSKKPQESFDASEGWIGLSEKYWLTALVPNQTEAMKFRFNYTKALNAQSKDRYQTDVTGTARTLAPGEKGTFDFRIFSGAKKVKVLDHYEEEWKAKHFDLGVDFGWFYFLTKPFFFAINYFYELTGNFGIAIIIFTCLLRVFVFPLANISYRSFAKMQKISPQMYNLRAEYKDDKMKLQQELVKLYQTEKVNPMAGCLPMLIQIPIFFALYKVLSNTIEMRHAPFYGWIHDLSAADPTTIFNLFGLIPWTPPSFLMIGIWPCLMMAAMILQRNISPPPQDPIQARIIGLMPYFMTYIMAGFASGLVIYWTVNNLLAVVQQIIIMKSMGVKIHLFNRGDNKKMEEVVESGPTIHPELEAAEEQIEDAIDGATAKILSKPKPKKKKKK